MKKERAIEILQNQIAKLDDLHSQNYRVWQAQTKTYILNFFGEGSPQYIYFDKFYLASGLSNDSPLQQIKRNINEARNFLNSSIELIEHNGLYKPPKQNFLYTMRGDVVAAFAIAIAGGLFYLGTVVGNQSAGNAANEFKQQLKECNDSLLRVSAAFKVTDTISKANANKNK